VKTIKTVDLVNNFKNISNWLEENNQEWVTVSRPKNKNIVLMTKKEANELARNRKNLEYLMKLDRSVEESGNGEAYEYFDDGTFSETPVKVSRCQESKAKGRS
jgi:antitoxin YefM